MRPKDEYQKQGSLWTRRDALKAVACVGVGLFAPRVARATGAYIGAQNAIGTSWATATMDTTGANLLVAFCGVQNGGGYEILGESVGGQTNTWTKFSEVTSGSKFTGWYCANPAHVGPSHSFIALEQDYLSPAVGVIAFSGMSATPLDVFNNALTWSSGLGRFTQILHPADNVMVVKAIYTGSQSSCPPLTMASAGAGSNSVSLAYAYQAVSADVDAVWSPDNNNSNSVIVSFKGGVASSAKVRHSISGGD
jgi:hypothetical protein